jgi:hypothetical protein
LKLARHDDGFGRGFFGGSVGVSRGVLRMRERRNDEWHEHCGFE